ncbi:MAG: PQQ-dependent sugar dehydrogenase [Alphaproteobacteria bacterium]|nr:PQQ-dependent sugar dehydrogenase [Alphaproteobacteria bacterium]
MIREVPVPMIENFITNAGGRIVEYKDNKILFAVGDYIGNPQTDDNTYGKIIAIDKQTGDYEIISKGHRNPQGLYYDAVQDVIISTEHGPQGGDEINVNLNPGGDEIENYGWPIASYGWPYSMDPETDISPFKKTHADYGFIEPIIYFVPSIATSEIIKVNERFNGVQGNQFFLAALSGSNPDIESGGHGITHYILDDEYNVKSRDVFHLEGRVRDLMYVESLNKIIGFREWDQALVVISEK